ncbi:hypothetical protein TrVE_jg3101 [Triparma verrucosa]|uniref:Uncharacterized protein n=1 Tax=Triparma verrucosa TaxID=1606542 RepID=A0A9W7EI00_9STRA|nr:hypothetical protein TrVE_jg3101 [Triparma verrucosa]
MPPAPLTSLSKALALESSMEDEVSSIEELILRSMDLSSIDASLSVAMCNLTTLSLSHNMFTSLVNFRNLRNLKDLNLNFNKLTSECIEELAELKFLKSLFLSNNMLDDESLIAIARLSNSQGSFADLSTLCLFSNKLSSLPLLQRTLSLLVNLKDCSFEGNETSSKEGYRQAVIRSCKSLEVLDGVDIEELDHELCVDGDNDDNDGEESSKKSAVPKLNLKSINNRSPTEHTTTFGGLNSDPILLTYRASEMLDVEKEEDDYNYGDEEEGEDERIKALADDLQKAKSKGSRKFVGRLRGSSVSKGATSTSSTTPSHPNANANANTNTNNNNNSNKKAAEDITRAAAMLNVHGVALSDTFGEVREVEVPKSMNHNDPWEIVRKLLVKCETLDAENKSLKKHSINGGTSSNVTLSGMDEMRKELECLRRENSNMYTLIEENKGLRKELEVLKIENEGLRMGRGGGGQKGAWSMGGAEVLTLEDVVPSYPDVGLPTPRTSSAGSSVSSSRPSSSRPSSRPSSSRPGSRSGSRPSTAGSRKGLYDDLGLERPNTATERIQTGFLQKLREEAGLTVENPNDEYEFSDDEDVEDAEILDLIERNETGLARIRQDLITANKELLDYEKKENKRDGKNTNTSQGNTNTSAPDTAATKLSVRQLLELRNKKK